jgi:polyhydroxyalkanoate synthesis regulator phasin
VNFALQEYREYTDTLLKRIVELEKTNDRRLKEVIEATDSLAMCRKTIATQDLRIRQLIEEVNNLKFDNVRVNFPTV